MLIYRCLLPPAKELAAGRLVRAWTSGMAQVMAYLNLVKLMQMRRALDAALLSGVSALALIAGSQPSAAASKQSIGSVAPTVAAQQAATAAALQAAAAAAQAQSSLNRAAEALAAAQRLQSGAAAAGSALFVPNGLAPGGLVPTDPTYSTNQWTGADAPVQSVSGSQVTVNIQQTQQKALLYWNTFNVGANTTVNFEQQQSNWIALNRVYNSTSPSQILGNVNALGAVYLINSNGIIFGAGSQINVNTLIASSLDIGQLGTSLTARDQFFLNTGIANLNSFSFYDWATQGSATSNAVAGDITVQRGAKITANIATDLVSQGSPGNIYLFGANVYNSGWLVAPTGEVGMVAGRTIDIVPNGYSILPTSVLGTDSSGKTLTFRGTEFSISPFAASYNNDPNSGTPVGYPANGLPYLAGTGAVSHDGLIEASRGIVIMNGDTVTISNPRDTGGNLLTDPATGSLIQGVISVDTSIDRNSFVMLRAATSVTMNGVITSLPYDDGAQPLPAGGSAGSTVQSFAPPYIEMSAQTSVTVGSSGLVSAPSAVVSLRAISLDQATLYEDASVTGTLFQYHLFNQGGNPVGANTNTPSLPQTVLLAPGATIDVAGLENVTLPASYNFISIKPFNEFADMPLQRNGPLSGQTLWIDINASGTRSDGTSWVGTPLADASSDVSNVGRSIYQLMTTGGSVNLQTDLTTANGGGRVQTAGSVINVAGGNVTFEPGWVPTTLLLGADGRIYNMANADPNRVYVGIANQFSVDHSRWGITETWSTQTYASGYSEGHAAGSISITTVNPAPLGTMYFGSVAGERQIENGQLPSQGSLSLTTPQSIQIGSSPSTDYNTPDYQTQRPDVATQTPYVLSADTLSGYGLSALNVTANDLVLSSGSVLNLAPGGSFSVVTGGAIDIAGTVAAAGGAVSLTTNRSSVDMLFGGSGTGVGGILFRPPTDATGNTLAANVYVEGTIDVSGRFVNDTGRTVGNLTGPGYINGGSISIATNKAGTGTSQTTANGLDETGSILLAQGSLLDVSSGGYINQQGKPKTALAGDPAGLLAGSAGSISLSIYGGVDPVKSAAGTVGFIELDGSLRAFGFQNNGSLTLTGVDTVRIGGSLQNGETSGIHIAGVAATLPVSLFTEGGFGSYTIESVSDGWTSATANVIVSAGVNLPLQQQNLASNIDYSGVATGTKLGQQAAPALELLPADRRQPVNLTLKADNILLDKGSTIATDPKASITIGDLAFDTAVSTTGNLPPTSVQLLGSIIDHGGSVFINATTTQLGSQALVDLSGTFVASSTFGWQQGGSLTSGTYLPGGTFTVEAGTYTTTQEGNSNTGTAFSYSAYLQPSSSSYLVADRGALVDVSGAAGAIQVAGPHGTNSSMWSWSDAGTVSADVAGFAWGGGFAAAGGRYTGADGKTYADPRANNGTIILGGASINLSQDMAAVSSVLSSFHQGQGVPSSLFVAAGQLEPFDNAYLFAGWAPGGAKRIFTDLNGNIYGYGSPVFDNLNIAGNLNLDVANRLHIAAADISASPISPASSISAQLTAPYIELTGGGVNTNTGSSTLTISAQTIDVEGAAFSGFSQVNLISSGDLRLGTVKVADGVLPGANSNPIDTNSFTGSLASGGNLLLSAQRIYPISAVTFTIQTPGNVQFTAPAGSNTSIPLAAGGGITVIASTIDQAGNLFAPLGQITLGNASTQSVTLEPGSLTSVTLANTIVPYGATVDGSSWYYNASLTPLSQPPSKGVVLAGSNVSVAQGSTIDLRGGGDLQAMEWVAGKGGSRDTLTTTPSGQTVYALVPSANAAVAAYDIDFATSRSLDNGATITAGDTNPLVGTQITIAGGGGIAGGTYTLYPAHYATLPGAMRVVVYKNSNLGENIPSGTTLSDGTVLVTGNYTQSTAAGKQSSGQTVFAVQTNAVWQSYSEYQFSSANSYFAQVAAKNGTIIPLPIDAGSLQAIALQSINLKGVFLDQPGQDSSGNLGHGSTLDIASPQMIDIIGDAQYASGNVPAGYVAIDVSQLDSAGFDSILIGGLRSTTGSGLITPVSPGILVDTNGQAFTAPEILLVSTPATTTTSPSSNPTPVANTGNITIASGSVINTTGTVNAAAGRKYYFGALPGNAAQSVATALGGTLDPTGTVINGANASAAGSALQSYIQNTTGALFVATNDATLNASGPTGTPLTVNFTSGGSAVLAADAGKVIINRGASIITGALTLQATASTQAIVLDATDTNSLHVGQLNLTAQTIALGSTSPLTSVSLPLYNFQFADVGGLALKPLAGTISVYGDYNPGSSVSNLTLDAPAVVQAPGTADAQISAAGTITLQNSGAATGLTSPLATPQTTLGFNATQIVLGSAAQASAQTILGYANVDLNASERVVIAGPGSLTLGYNEKNSDGTFTFVDAVNLMVKTPLVLVAGASGASVAGASGQTNGSFAISTGGGLSILDTVPQSGWGAQPADSAEVGGSLALTAANITVGNVIQAQAGTITLEATKGDVTLLPHANLDAGGYAKTLIDVTTYIAGGKVVLESDAGNVNVGAYTIIDVAQPAGGLGYGGEVDVTAPNGNATFAGLMFGGGGSGLGGTFNLNIKGAVDLGHVDPVTGIYQPGLADQLSFGQFTGSINIETQTGNIVLAQGHTLKANSITLTADDPTWDKNNPAWDPTNPNQLGQVQIYGTLDASGYSGTTLDGSGEAGGQVALYGANAVVLGSTGVINASTTHADQRGGDVTIGIGWNAQSKIYLQAFTEIDVSGGTKGGLSGGTVTFVAPRDGNNDMKIAELFPGGNVEAPAIGGQINGRNAINIIGARSVTFDDYVSFDTTTPVTTPSGTTTPGSIYGLDAAGLGWSGIIDPRGWYTSYTDATHFTLATSGTWTNVTGWTLSSSSSVQTFQGFTTPPSSVTITTPDGTQAVATAQMGVFQFTVPQSTLAQFKTGDVVQFAAPNGGQAATGVIAQQGTLHFIKITNPGTGYLTNPQSATVIDNGQPTQVTATTSSLTVSGVQFTALSPNGFSVDDSKSSPQSTYTFSFGSSNFLAGKANVTLSLASGFSGSGSINGSIVTFTPIQGESFVPLAQSINFNPSTQGQSIQINNNVVGQVGAFAGSTPSQNFVTSVLEQVTSGLNPTTGQAWSYNGQSYGFSNLFSRLQPLVAQLGAGVVQVQPGVQLVNSQGDITVLSNWNLASGSLYSTTTNATPQSYDPANPANYYVNFNYRLITPWNTVDAGSLTLRTKGDINIDASISDGFFQFNNYLDPNYVAAVSSYINALDGTTSNGVTPGPRTFANDYNYYLNGPGTAPIAPYNAFANAVSPSSQDLAAADLFPNSLTVCTGNCGTSNPNLTTVTAPSSWSYTLTAGADLASANPMARIALASAIAGKTGDVIVNNHTTYAQTVIEENKNLTTQVLVNLPTMVRTGTGDITVAAARDVTMADTIAPGVIYAAGVNTPSLPGANYSSVSSGGASSVVAGNPDGFLEPQVLAYGNGGAIFSLTSGGTPQFGVLPYYGPPTAAAFPEMGGDVVVDAQRDVVGYSGSGNKVLQYYQPWLLADSGLTPLTSAAGAAALFGAGVFAPSGSQIASQTAWWIQYSSFQQGILSAGGNVTVVAGRDLVDVSVSLPTTGRVSGGLTASDTPVTHLYDSGNMVVRAGRNILGGSFYEGSGFATIVARGAIGQNGTVSKYATSALQLPDLPLLAVDTGTIEMVSLGSLSFAGVVNPAALQAQRPTLANPLESAVPPTQPLYLDTYGPDSGVSLEAVTGNLTISIAPTAVTDKTNSAFLLHAAPATYPASLQALALNGDLKTTGIEHEATDFTIAQIPTPGIVLSPSDHGLFELLAQGSVDLTFGFPDNTTLLPNTPRPYISAGSSLIDTGFDPFRPNSGFDGASPGALLAHADDAQAGIDATARIYAVSGSIKTTGNYGPSYQGDITTTYQIIQINRPTQIYAGTDITDLNVIIQNIQTNDVSTITAGRNITYTGYNNGGGIQIAGPGTLVVQAGGDIGPFLPSNVDNKAQAQVQEGIASVGNASATPVGDVYVESYSVGIYDQALFGPITRPRRNTELTAAAGTSQGANVDVLFGIKSPPDYQAMIDNYINPAAPGSYQGYTLNIDGVPTDPQTGWAMFQKMSPAEQRVLIYQVFFDIIKNVGKIPPTAANCPQVCEPAWKVISTLFPWSGNTIGTSELNLLHGTIQTHLGGSVSIFGPSGNITVGSLATEPNPNLKLRDLGILTLGGGDINTYTSGNVLVNSSRVLTTQGGDVTMWTSYGDLDAGRGSKTIVSAPALVADFDQNDYETIDPGGYVTGSGIGTLQASRTTPVGNLYLIAPNGTIDFGTAGVRSSGSAVFVAPVITNASNFQVSGSVTGVPSVPSLSSSVSQSANTTTQNKPDADVTRSGPGELASVFIVEVVGYGGGDSDSQAPQQDEANKKGSEGGTGSRKQMPKPNETSP